jgi:hypothetical protein
VEGEQHDLLSLFLDAVVDLVVAVAVLRSAHDGVSKFDSKPKYKNDSRMSKHPYADRSS